MATAKSKFPYGSVKLLGKEYALRKDGKTPNLVGFKKEDKTLVKERLDEIKKSKREITKRELEEFLKTLS
jgi:hypothetical protein